MITPPESYVPTKDETQNPWPSDLVGGMLYNNTGNIVANYSARAEIVSFAQQLAAFSKTSSLRCLGLGMPSKA